MNQLARSSLNESALSPTQARRKRQLLRAARRLAQDNGAKAVTIAAVAERARTTRVTVYHYFANRDQLLTAVAMDWGAELIRRIMRTPLQGATVAEQVRQRFEQLLRRFWSEPKLVDAVVATFVSDEPDIAAATERYHTLIRLYLSSAVQDPDFEYGEEVERAIGHLFLSVLLGLCTGWLELEMAVADLTGGLRLILQN